MNQISNTIIKKNYIAVDIKTGENLYKLARIFEGPDQSVYISPEIKTFIGSTLCSEIKDIHIATHTSGQNHIRIKGIDMKKFRIKQITQISEKSPNWYICINASGKEPKNIFPLSLRDPLHYLKHYTIELNNFPQKWFSIYIKIAENPILTRNKDLAKLIGHANFEAFNFHVDIVLCEGRVEKRSSIYDIKFNPQGTQFPFEDDTTASSK